MKKLLAVLTAVMGFASVSQADIMIEPYLGYEMGTFGGGTEGKLDGTQMGLRLAYATPVMLWLGVDGTTTVSATFKPEVGANEGSKRTSLYAVAGVDLPILLRGWVGYGFSNELKGDESDKLTGTSMKVGVGFTGLPFVSLNLEYLKETFNEVGGLSLPEDITNDAYVLSVSLPLEF